MKNPPSSSLAKRAAAILAALCWVFALDIQASTSLDLATPIDINDLSLGPVTTQGTINGAIYKFGQVSGGTGNLDPFLRIQSTGTEAGYNTDNSSPAFDEKTGSFTHSFLLGNAGTVDVGGTIYLEFVLDVNESQGGGDDYLSLDEIKVFESPAGNLNTTDLSDGGPLGDLKYDLDAGMDNEVLLFTYNAGGGVTDYTVLVPLWSNPDPTKYLTFYSSFGAKGTEGSGQTAKKWGSGSGPEEWALDTGRITVTQIPEPSNLLISVAFCLTGFFFHRSRPRKSR